jgi:hypothetical protein
MRATRPRVLYTGADGDKTMVALWNPGAGPTFLIKGPYWVAPPCSRLLQGWDIGLGVHLCHSSLSLC